MASLSAREQAYQTIRSRIITMELKPGDTLYAIFKSMSVKVTVR